MKKVVLSAVALSALALSGQAYAQDKLTIFWVKGFYKAEDDALYEAIAKFEKKSGVKVDLSQYAVQDMIPKTVAAMDVLAPGIGEIIGGSQREERLDYLDRRLAELHLDPKAYWWYRDLRRFGTVPHAGFGLGLERTIIYATGMANIRDVIPFPRTPGHAAF